MRKFIMGDIHGAHKAMIQCFHRSGFNKNEDLLIQLGDVVDRGSDSFECVEELINIKNKITIRGNHDSWIHTFFKKNYHPVEWLHGGNETKKSYIKNCGDLKNAPLSHIDFFNNQKLYHVDKENNIFIHGGFDTNERIEFTLDFECFWDTSLWVKALSFQESQKLSTVENFNEIFIGHSNTLINGSEKPMYSGGVWNLDTGAGFHGKLTMMELSTKEYWQSDLVMTL
jgi:serine/threonine protein phosphatase 1